MQTSPKCPMKKSITSIKSTTNKKQPGLAASSIQGETSQLPFKQAQCEKHPHTLGRTSALLPKKHAAMKINRRGSAKGHHPTPTLRINTSLQIANNMLPPAGLAVLMGLGASLAPLKVPTQPRRLWKLLRYKQQVTAVLAIYCFLLAFKEWLLNLLFASLLSDAAVLFPPARTQVL